MTLPAPGDRILVDKGWGRWVPKVVTRVAGTRIYFGDAWVMGRGEGGSWKMDEKQEIIEHDAVVWDHRVAVLDYTTVVELVNRALGGEPDEAALTIAVADQMDLWDGDDLPEWVYDAAEAAMERADDLLAEDDEKVTKILDAILKYRTEAKR